MQDFTAKRDALFACLDDASKELKGTALDQTSAEKRAVNVLQRTASAQPERTLEIELVYRSGERRRWTADLPSERSLSHLRGKESIFKKPGLPIGRCLKPRKTPDYQINPHKWKKYSLSDVDISDQTNSSAAFAFLKQMDEQRDAQTAMETEHMLPADQKIEFKQSSKLRRNIRVLEAAEVQDAEVDKPKMRGSKLLMPEYVVGQKREKQRKKAQQQQQNAERAAGKLMLAHLQEEDETAEDEQIEEG